MPQNYRSDIYTHLAVQIIEKDEMDLEWVTTVKKYESIFLEIDRLHPELIDRLSQTFCHLSNKIGELNGKLELREGCK